MLYINKYTRNKINFHQEILLNVDIRQAGHSNKLSIINSEKREKFHCGTCWKIQMTNISHFTNNLTCYCCQQKVSVTEALNSIDNRN